MDCAESARALGVIVAAFGCFGMEEMGQNALFRPGRHRVASST